MCAVGMRNKWRDANNILALQKQMLINNKIVGAIPSETCARNANGSGVRVYAYVEAYK